VLVYREETKQEDVTCEGIAAAMKQGIKEKTTKLMVKLGKMTAVANPAHGPELLEEVYYYVISSFTIDILPSLFSKESHFHCVRRLNVIGV
jgi:hypothetical protein